MSTAFNHFLGNNSTAGTIFKSYDHASKLYVNNNYARAPKLGFLYFVSFNINAGVVKDQGWLTNGQRDVGLLVKKIDMPKFKIATETVNQYNRKVNVQTKIVYEPVTIELHDDNSEISNGLWKNYYKYYYQDSNWGDVASGTKAYQNTKYGNVDYGYGLSNYQDKNFFDSISIYVLHQHKFTEMTLANPLISSWDHDSLDQSDGKNILRNKMSVVYEDVIYRQGAVIKGSSPGSFGARYYDNVTSPLVVGGNSRNSIPGANGQIPSDISVFGANAPYPLYNIPIAATPPQPGPGMSMIDKAYSQQGNNGGLSIGLFMGHLTISGALPLGPLNLGFSLTSGKNGFKGTQTINAGPVTLAKRI